MKYSIKYILSKLPDQPGVYKMLNQENQIIYIGKAKNLKKRVKSYFNKQIDNIKTQKLVQNINNIEYIITNSDLEAILLETNLIKEHRPKYNILMKDDKNFAYIKITLNEDYPRIFVTRKVLKDGAKYIGPKSSAGKIYQTLNLLRKLFPYRNCNLNIEDQGKAENVYGKKRKVKVTRAGIKYPCLDLHIKRCLGPCVGIPDINAYQNTIKQIIGFLEGKYQEVIEIFKTEMINAANQKNFEKAAKIRDKIQDIEELFEKQIISTPDHQDSDIINFYLENEKAYFNVFQIRNGKIIDQQNLTLKINLNESDNDILEKFLLQFYLDLPLLPSRIIIPATIENQSSINEILTNQAKHKVELVFPHRGKSDQLLELSLENAKSYANQSRAKWESKFISDREMALDKLAQYIGLDKLPRRIECYDVSHLSGTHTVASMVVFENGFPNKSHYRHFKIDREFSGNPDDFASINEVILRRIKYLKPELDFKDLKVLKNKENIKVKKSKHTVFNGKMLYSSKLKTIIQIDSVKIQLIQKITRKILNKYKTKRIYFILDQPFADKLLTIGFEELKKIPKEIQKIPEGNSIIVFDKNKNFEDNSFKRTPDLIVIDGGKGQLSSAIKAFKKDIKTIPIISLAKKEEEIFMPNQKKSLKLDKTDPSSLLLQHIRNEAHRFAIEYNRKLRKKDYTVSGLEDIEGIGKSISNKLLKKFGSIKNIKLASEEEIAEITGTRLAIKMKNNLF
ncbi:excinuclease ABC subunit UvrC [Candidatus Peregrinibacteria bacterium]|nr:excinuclease ABC subunit UvrC [Candidatus Peregrinibacteria bacterium]